MNINTASSQNNRLEPFFLMSVALHLLFFASAPNYFSNSEQAPTPLSRISLTSIPEEARPQDIPEIVIPPRDRRIVSQPLEESQSGSIAKNPMLAERDISVEKESVKKGELPSQIVKHKPSSTIQSESKSKKQAAKKTTKVTPNLDKKEASQPKLKRSNVASLSTIKDIKSTELESSANSALDSLKDRLNEDTVVETLDKGDKSESATPSSALQDYVNAQIGIPDFLPDIRDGELTLLNTKASTYAVFVRRVAQRVFADLKTQLWSSGLFDQSISESSTISVLLNSSGEIHSLSVLGSEGRSSLDRYLAAAARTNAWDHNPPKEAFLEDGYLHLLFKAKVKVSRAANPRNPSYWIMLSTGLE